LGRKGEGVPVDPKIRRDKEGRKKDSNPRRIMKAKKVGAEKRLRTIKCEEGLKK